MRLSAEQLRQRIESMGITEEQVAERLGVRMETLHRWLEGKARIPGHVCNAVQRLERSDR